MRYLSNRLADFDKICMAMHISRFNQIGDQKFENLKIQDCGRSDFDKILYGAWRRLIWPPDFRPNLINNSNK